MKKIKVGQSKNNFHYAMVSDSDYSLVNKHIWYLDKSKLRDTIYAITLIQNEEGKNVRIKMHVLILGKHTGKVIDHINHNGLDNQRENLRVVTQLQNRQNSMKHNSRKKYSSKYKGVTRHPYDEGNQERWIASIRANGKSLRLGIFKNEIEAAKSYDEAAKMYFGEFSYLNF
jgi:hypothetical protein